MEKMIGEEEKSHMSEEMMDYEGEIKRLRRELEEANQVANAYQGDHIQLMDLFNQGLINKEGQPNDSFWLYLAFEQERLLLIF